MLLPVTRRTTSPSTKPPVTAWYASCRPARPVGRWPAMMATTAFVSSRFSRRRTSGGRFWMPARWIRTWRIVIHCFPLAPNSGMYSQTGSSRRSRFRWSSRWIIIAVTAFDADRVTNGESGVSGTARVSGGSPGPLPLACPMARSRSTCPWRRTQRASAGMHAAPVEALGRVPDAIARRGVDAQLARRHLRFPADARDRVQIGRHARTR